MTPYDEEWRDRLWPTDELTNRAPEEWEWRASWRAMATAKGQLFVWQAIRCFCPEDFWGAIMYIPKSLSNTPSHLHPGTHWYEILRGR